MSFWNFIQLSFPRFVIGRIQLGKRKIHTKAHIRLYQVYRGGSWGWLCKVGDIVGIGGPNESTNDTVPFLSLLRRKPP